ncbi:MAG: HIT family protein [Sulfolobaceae archaeon]
MCVFCKIIKREEEGYIVYQDEYFTSFLDKYPVAPGHTLIATNKHFEDLLKVDGIYLQKIGEIIKLIGNAVIRAMKADGIRVVSNIGRSAGQVIFHTHIHIVPSWEAGIPKEFSDFRPRVELPKSYYTKVQKMISEEIIKQLGKVSDT